MPEYGIFSKNDAERIAATVRRWGSTIPGGSPNRPRNRRAASNLPVKIVAPSGGIPAMVGDTYGGPVTCQVVVKNASDQQTNVTGFTVDVYSYMSVVTCANGNRRGHAKQFSDGWFVVGDDCQDTQGFSDGFSEGFN